MLNQNSQQDAPPFNVWLLPLPLLPLGHQLCQLSGRADSRFPGNAADIVPEENFTVKEVKRILKHMKKLNILQLLQLGLHPQPICLVLEFSCIMEHLKTTVRSKGQVWPQKYDEGTYHATLCSASSLLSDPRVNKGQVRFFHLRFLYLHLQQFKFMFLKYVRCVNIELRPRVWRQSFPASSPRPTGLLCLNIY